MNRLSSNSALTDNTNATKSRRPDTSVSNIDPTEFAMSSNGDGTGSARPRRAKGKYITLHYDDEIGCCDAIRLWFKDFPYSFFSVRRKRPGEKEHRLKWKTEIPFKFESFFWGFDNCLIEVCQLFHHHHDNKCRKIGGWIFYVLNNLVCFAANLQTLMVVTLFLCLFQYDAPALVFNHCIFFNVIVV